MLHTYARIIPLGLNLRIIIKIQSSECSTKMFEYDLLTETHDLLTAPLH